MSWLTALGLCVAGLAAIIIEFFVPAAGIIGVLGLGSIVGGIVVAYREYGTLIGSIYLISAAIVTPAVVIVYFKMFPRSVVGKWLILGHKSGAGENKTEGNANIDIEDPETGSGSPFEALVGKSGTSISSLRPAGTVRIDGKKYSVVTGGEFIDSGRDVIVTRVRGNRIHVKQNLS